MYLVGAEKFDKKDDDWACNINYEPEYKYLDLFDPKLNDSKWEEVLEYSILMITDYLKNNKSFISNIENITTGFDGGDLTLLK